MALSIYIPGWFSADLGSRVHHVENGREAAKLLMLERDPHIVAPHIGTTRAQDVHQPSQRIGDRPKCIRRLDVKAALSLITTPPPDRPRPTPALRIIRAAEDRAA